MADRMAKKFGIHSSTAIGENSEMTKSQGLHDELASFLPITGQGINRILSKVQKSFWSCTHVNSCQKYTLYINLHILLNILS